MQMPRSKTQYLPTTILIIVALFVWFLTSGGIATAGYADSAHGDTLDGVNRSGAECPTGTLCPQGDCGHCHDTFDPGICGVNELMLFDPANDDNFCFKCHDGTSNVQDPAFSNDNYSKTFGGAATADFTNVYDAFHASTSSHDLAALLTWAEENHPEWGFTSNSNPCTLCHNPHLDKRNWLYPGDPTYTAIRRPSEHDSDPGNLWGDDTDERMNSSWSAYRPPYYTAGSNYEPGGTSDHNGSKHPDYASLCLDCHSVSVNGLDSVNWTQVTSNDWIGGIHGEEWFDFHPTFGDVKAPYPLNTDYVLSCLDCHEPHGSSNPRMVRTTVNGVSGLTYELSNNALIETWCGACHEYAPAYTPMHFGFRQGYCTGGPGQDDCHTHGGDYPL
jgi:predicted CXXCH cytochrome family protein